MQAIRMMSAYAVSKTALIRFSEATALETAGGGEECSGGAAVVVFALKPPG